MAGRQGFPGPFVQEAKIDNSTMDYGPPDFFENMSIGARPNTMKRVGSDDYAKGMTLEHVGTTAGRGKK